MKKGRRLWIEFRGIFMFIDRKVRKGICVGVIREVGESIVWEVRNEKSF